MMDPATEAENRDLLAYLRLRGFGAIVTAAADPDCLRGGILSGNALSRRSGISPRQAWRMMREAREVLRAELTGRAITGRAITGRAITGRAITASAITGRATSTAMPSTLFSLTPPPITIASASACN